MKRWLLASVSPILLCFVSIVSAKDECIVNDEEEYAVLAAVLFPNTPEVPERMKSEIEKNAYLATKTIRLDGFHGNHYFIQDESMLAKSAKNKDREMIPDFNTKNARACKFVAEKLQAYVPPGKTVSFKSSEEVRRQLSVSSGRGPKKEGFPANSILEKEITQLSRPGFNEPRTVAVVEVDLRADYEMGVGYWVYLEKSSKTRKWVITSADRVRMY